MKNYTFKKVDEKPTLDSPVWNDVEKAVLDNDNFCGENAEKITVTAGCLHKVRHNRKI